MRSKAHRRRERKLLRSLVRMYLDAGNSPELSYRAGREAHEGIARFRRELVGGFRRNVERSLYRDATRG